MTRALALTVLLAVAACGPLVQVGGGGKPPGVLFTLRAPPPAPVVAVAVPIQRTVLIDLPGVSGALQTLRLPVTEADTRVTYLVAAAWAEAPARQFQRVLVDTLAARPGTAALAAGAIDGRADRRLSGTLIEFGLDVRATPATHLRFDAVLTGPDRALIAVRRFERTEPVASNAPADVAVSLNRAANAAAADIAAWVAAN